MLVRSLHLQGLLSFGPDAPPIALQPLNVLIGPNASGKSNLIEAIALLRSLPRDLTAPIRESGGVGEWLFKGPPKARSATVAAIIDNPRGRMPLRYVLECTSDAQRPLVLKERIENEQAYAGKEKPYFYYLHELDNVLLNVRMEGEETRERRLKREEIAPDQSILAQRKDPDQYPEITYLGETLATIRVYRNWSFGRYTPPRLPQPADSRNDFLEEGCQNLGLVLNRLRRDASTKQKILKEIQKLYDGIEDFDVIIEGGTVQVFMQEDGITVPATRLSDGTLRYLSLLAILCHPSPPPLVCIEEPELGLHPEALPNLAALLQEASERCQLIVTTHSDVLVDAFTDSPEAVLVCEKDHGSTRMRRLEKEPLREWLERYGLGELWLKGELGGGRW
ncbi:MAG: chromosome segregation protein SMC [Planctomycetota bacterium]|nr:MAG: chromosome segregation protein SMC [Planctomycetota bacterium]